MAHAENTVTISRDPEDVLAFLTDGLNNPLWRSGVRSIALKSGTGGEPGAVYSQTLAGPGGRGIAGDYQITELVPGLLLRFQVVAGPARPEGKYRLGVTPSGTEVHFVLNLQPKGFMKLMGSMISKSMEAEVAQLDALKKVLESGTS